MHNVDENIKYSVHRKNEEFKFSKRNSEELLSSLILKKHLINIEQK